MSDFLDVRDSRTSRTYRLPVINNSVKGADLAKITSLKKINTMHHDPSTAMLEEKLKVFDPGYENTAVMQSSITFLYVLLL